ncbi:MAG: hypothetical protein KAI66_16185 [Lentisphaeria bacterium]|nr:hypothetical protein [Lentisphaeria bacterium]
MNTNKTLPALMLALLLGGCVAEDSDPTCGPNGTYVEANGDAYCDCDDGYCQGDGLVCISCGGMGLVGEICNDDADCADGRCLKYTGDTEGYCTTTQCQIDNDCVNHATEETAEMCCVQVDQASFICLKVAEGYACGDGTGTCGTSCTGTADSACGIEYPCLRSSDTDPNAICSAPCATDADCSACEWNVNPDTWISCITISGGDKYCLIGPLPDCETSTDCSEGNTCSIGVSPDMSELLGECMKVGALSPGSACNDEDDPSELSYENRCSGFYCFGGMCSEVCSLDIDCPEGMSCLEHTFEDVDDSITVCKGN